MIDFNLEKNCLKILEKTRQNEGNKFIGHKKTHLLIKSEFCNL